MAEIAPIHTASTQPNNVAVITRFYEFRRELSTGFYEYRRMPIHPQTLFGQRLRAARKRAQIAQDRLGVMIGLDEGTSSARMSRYESGVHEPPFQLAEKIADALHVPVAYFYCPDERVAQLLLEAGHLNDEQIDELLHIARTMNAHKS